MNTSPTVLWQCPPKTVLVGVDFEDPSARACAEHLAGIAGGRVIDGGPATHCEAGVMERASLVVMATGSDRPSWSITDPVARVLGACQRPVLFIPAQ